MNCGIDTIGDIIKFGLIENDETTCKSVLKKPFDNDSYFDDQCDFDEKFFKFPKFEDMTE